MAEQAEQTEGPVVNLGNIISENLKESLKNLDVMSIIRQMVSTTPDNEESEEVRNRLQEVIEKYNSMSDEQKVDFAAKMKEALTSKISAKLSDPNAFNLSELETQLGELIFYRLMLLAAAALVVFVLFVFFGYKLYKSIKEKEKKREEKKKAKQMKKKK